MCRHSSVGPDYRRQATHLVVHVGEDVLQVALERIGCHGPQGERYATSSDIDVENTALDPLTCARALRVMPRALSEDCTRASSSRRAGRAERERRLGVAPTETIESGTIVLLQDSSER